MSEWTLEGSMQPALMLALLLAVFLAGALAMEGLSLIWHQTRSPQMMRLKKRIRAWMPELDATLPSAQTALGPQGMSPTDSMSSTQARLGRWMAQAGLRWTVQQWVALSAALGALGAALAGAVAYSTGASVMACAALAGLLAAALPWSVLAWKRHQRMSRLLVQMPDALELIARAMRSGHSFTAALQMVGEETAAPLSEEFAWVHDQLAYGRDFQEAFDALSQRVPLDDMRFFVTAVKLQRQTGGNLAELLINIGELIRQRLKLLAKVRALSAEGRLSAQVLALMPLVMGGIIYLIRPDFISVLWIDEVGVSLIKASAGLYLLGGVWMWRMTQLRL